MAILYGPDNILLDFPITNQNISVLYQSECAYLHCTDRYKLIKKWLTKKGEHSDQSMLFSTRVIPQHEKRKLVKQNQDIIHCN